MTKTNRIIAYGLTQEEATAAHRHLISTMGCASENITIITDPADIFSLRAGEVNLVGVKAHVTDQQQWSKLMINRNGNARHGEEVIITNYKSYQI